MIRRLRTWWWHRTHPADLVPFAVPCGACEGTLHVCDVCEGAWRHGCRACNQGLVCTHCRTRHWTH